MEPNLFIVNKNTSEIRVSDDFCKVNNRGLSPGDKR